MITEIGKNILAKYLIGQAPAYASYIAVGCGARPIDPGANLGDYSAKNLLDFEMFRVPIISRGYVSELDEANNVVSKVVFTAELPTEERYEISEVGIFAAASNPSALGADSRMLFSFNNQNEIWEYHSATSAVAIPVRYDPINGTQSAGTIGIPDPVFNVNSDNEVFANLSRVSRNEVPRFLNNTIAIVGNNCDLNLSKRGITNVTAGSGFVTVTTAVAHNLVANNDIFISGVTPTAFNLNSVKVHDVLSPTSFRIQNPATGSYVSGGIVEKVLSSSVPYSITGATNHIHLTGIGLDLDKNSPNDLLKVAFSIAHKSGVEQENINPPDSIRLLVEFASTEVSDSESAKLEIFVKHDPTAGSSKNMRENRYFVESAELQSLKKTPGFTWSSVEVVKVFASVYKDGAPSSNYYTLLDGIRFENVTNTNPLYGLTGYSVIRNQEGRPITKLANTNNFIEFRFALDVK